MVSDMAFCVYYQLYLSLTNREPSKETLNEAKANWRALATLLKEDNNEHRGNCSKTSPFFCVKCLMDYCEGIAKLVYNNKTWCHDVEEFYRD